MRGDGQRPRRRRLALGRWSLSCLSGVLLLAAPAWGQILVPEGATWRYLDDGSDQGTLWRQPAPAFDDSSWASGPAQLGYGDGDEATTVASGPPSGHYITTYFRHEFNVVDAGLVEGLSLRILRDDGAVVYLNGAEVHRSNMPGGPIGHLTWSATTVGGADEEVFHQSAISTLALVTGTNLLAVEIHQRGPTSSDISFDFELVTTGPPGAPSLARGPYLQLGTPNSMVVRWRTDFATDTRLDWGSAPDHLTVIESDPVFKTEHEVAITGLQPATTYFYEIGDAGWILAGGDADHFFRTSPLAGSRRPLRIWVVGDSGECAVSVQGCLDATAVADAYLAFAAANGGRLADVWLMLGDNAYTTGTDLQYTQGLFEVYPEILRNTVLWPVPGNHEFGASDSPSQSGPYYEAFTLPSAAQAGGLASGTEAYYSFDYGNVHFAALDSHDTDRSAPSSPQTNVCPDPPQGGAMYQWLCDDLAATAQDWIISFWHHPPYTKGSHDSDVESQLIEMRERFLPVTEAFGGDINLTGHSHSYERSVLIDGHYGLSSTYVPAIHAIDSGDGDPAKDGAYVKPQLGPDPHQGSVYGVVGSSSKNTGGLVTHPIMAYAENYEGSMVIDVARGRLDGYWIDKDGAVKDRFTLLKGPNDVPALPVWGPAALILGLVGAALAGSRVRRPCSAI